MGLRYHVKLGRAVTMLHFGHCCSSFDSDKSLIELGKIDCTYHKIWVGYGVMILDCGLEIVAGVVLFSCDRFNKIAEQALLPEFHL